MGLALSWAHIPPFPGVGSAWGVASQLILQLGGQRRTPSCGLQAPSVPAAGDHPRQPGVQVQLDLQGHAVLCSLGSPSAAAGRGGGALGDLRMPFRLENTLGIAASVPDNMLSVPMQL